MPVRPAATVMIVRDGPHGDRPLEVLMVRRSLRSDFVGGAFVFPGGAVDPGDGESPCRGRTDAEASAVLGVTAGGLAYWVAGVRECFEEAGILLTYAGEGRDLLSLADPGDAARFARRRDDLNAGRAEFAEFCRTEGLQLAADRVHYFAHWITPAGAPRRYDTRFFVAPLPPGQEPAHDARETVAATWMRPADALASHRDGAIELIIPTIRCLQAIARFGTADELLLAVGSAASVETVVPKVVVDGRAVRVLLPGDPGYDEARPPPASVDVDGAVRAASRAANPEPEPG